MVNWFNNHCDRDFCQIALLDFTVIWTGSNNTEVLLTKICTMNFILLIVIAVFATIDMDKCFCCLQLIFLFIISGNWLTFPVYMSFYVAYCFHRFGNDLTEWHRLINFDDFFSTPRHCKKEIKSTSALKSDNDSSSLKYSGQFPSMQSFKLQSHVFVFRPNPEQWGIIYHLT